jgi:hypothetical protein
MPQVRPPRGCSRPRDAGANVDRVLETQATCNNHKRQRRTAEISREEDSERIGEARANHVSKNQTQPEQRRLARDRARGATDAPHNPMEVMIIANPGQASLPRETHSVSPQPATMLPRSSPSDNLSSSSPRDAVDPPDTPSTSSERQADSQPQGNPYATTRFHTPCDFAYTRRAPGGIRCATVNAQSISHPELREAVYPYFKAWDLDVLAIQETWLRPPEADSLGVSLFHASNGARAYSTVAPETDNRHLGVTLVLEEQLARHHQHTDAFGGTAIRVKLRWQRRELHIITAYIPPRSISNAAIGKDTISKVMEWLREARQAAI